MTDQNTPTVPPMLPSRYNPPLTNRERAIIAVNNFFDRYRDDEVDVEEVMNLDTEGELVTDLQHSIHITRKF